MSLLQRIRSALVDGLPRGVGPTAVPPHKNDGLYSRRDASRTWVRPRQLLEGCVPAPADLIDDIHRTVEHRGYAACFLAALVATGAWLRMLTAQGKSGQAMDNATRLLEEIPEQIAPGDFDQARSYRWDREKDRSPADKACRRILDALVQLREL